MLEVFITFAISCKHICIMLQMYIALTAVMHYTTITILTKTIAIDIALLVISACDYCRK